MAVMKKITDLKQLKLIANQIRQDIIKELVAAGSGHSAGSLGMADVFAALYFNVMRHDPQNPVWEERDRLVLSNGHICPVQYATMANVGYFSREELSTLRKFNTRLQGHPHRSSLPGTEITSGPLGSGLGQACGIAIGARMDKKKFRIWCLTSDGEHQEGVCWEAAMFAAKYHLHNLTVVIDRNNIQIDGNTEDIMPLEDFRKKYEAFNWHVIEVNGNNMQSIIAGLEESKTIYEKPTCVIAHTIPGKGVSFMEGDYEWHGKPPTQEQARIALAELEEERKMIERDEA